MKHYSIENILRKFTQRISDDISSGQYDSAKLNADRLSKYAHFLSGNISRETKNILFSQILSTTEFPTQKSVENLILEEFEVSKDTNKKNKKYYGAFLPSGEGCLWGSVYNIPTIEFIDALAKFIDSRNIRGPIIEIGAGSGKLSYGLQQKGINIIPIDNESFKLYSNIPIIHLDHNTALQKYQPAMVITSWLCPESGIQEDIVKFSSVKEYIEIRNSSSGLMGALGTTSIGVDESGRKILREKYTETNPDRYGNTQRNQLFDECNKYLINVDSFSDLTSIPTTNLKNILKQNEERIGNIVGGFIFPNKIVHFYRD